VVNGAEAAQREDQFIRAFEERIRAAGHLRNPLDGKDYAAAAGVCRRSDRCAELVDALKQRGAFSREAVTHYPLGRIVSLRVFRRFSRREVLLTAASLSRFETYLAPEPGAGAEPLGAAEVDRFVREAAVGPKTFAVFGFFSAAGWHDGVLKGVAEAARMCLAAPEAGGSWRVEHNLSEALQEYRWFFDPEGREGRLGRLAGAVRDRPELKVAGGFVPIAGLAAELGMDPLLSRQVLRRVVEADRRLEVVEVEGASILKHMRQ
jgi:hypothetical protein